MAFDVQAFALEWISAWNSHDVDRVLEHYTNDFEMSSPVIASVMGEPSGRLQGKQVVKEYWTKALGKIPNLHFTLVEVLPGANTAIILYHNQDHRLCGEMFFFNGEGMVYRSAAHYGSSSVAHKNP
eukprot:TRINITY_DN13006_c0_g1_i1.p1 TRINITY_DN13006_c0_g1~~TRINITY_DN13006_c0_g1_i1.p1  ORF type:complete len:126 (-),score=26.35 TRINITY_DN13006_c0_g1_i1:91-468(-)